MYAGTEITFRYAPDLDEMIRCTPSQTSTDDDRSFSLSGSPSEVSDAVGKGGKNTTRELFRRLEARALRLADGDLDVRPDLAFTVGDAL